MEIILANDAGINISTNFPLEVAQKPFPPVILINECQVSQCDKSKSIKACQIFSENFLGKIVSSFGKIDHDGFLLLDNVGKGNGLPIYSLYNIGGCALDAIIMKYFTSYVDHTKAIIPLILTSKKKKLAK